MAKSVDRKFHCYTDNTLVFCISTLGLRQLMRFMGITHSAPKVTKYGCYRTVDSDFTVRFLKAYVQHTTLNILKRPPVLIECPSVYLSAIMNGRKIHERGSEAEQGHKNTSYYDNEDDYGRKPSYTYAEVVGEIGGHLPSYRVKDMLVSGSV